jgi:hypothetical protein
MPFASTQKPAARRSTSQVGLMTMSIIAYPRFLFTDVDAGEAYLSKKFQHADEWTWRRVFGILSPIVSRSMS